VEFRGRNVTEGECFPIPIIFEILDTFSNSLDCASVFSKISIISEDQPKTALSAAYDHYE